MQISTPGSPKGFFERFVKLLKNNCFKQVLIFCSSWSSQGSKTSVLPTEFQHFSRDHRSAPGAQMDRQESALEFRIRSNTIKQGVSQGRPSNHSIKQGVSAFPNRQGAPFGLPKSHSKAFLVPSELPLDVYGRQNELLGRSRTSKLTSYGRFSKKTLKSCSENEWSKKKHYNSRVKCKYWPFKFWKKSII